MSIESNLATNFRSTPNPPVSVDFDRVWKNGLGSEMELSVDPHGNVTGTYRTNVGAPSPTEEFALVGFASGDLLTFTVNFGQYGTLTSWTGQHTEDAAGNPEIHTLWHLAKNIPDPEEPTNLWAGILAGANIFKR